MRRIRRSSSYVAVALGLSLLVVTVASAAPPAQTGTTRPPAGLPGPYAGFPLITAAPTEQQLVAASFALPALLGQHSVLVADMTRGRLRGDPDLAQATNAAISKNTTELAGLVKALFGEAAAEQFATLWSGHVQAFFNYARGLSVGDSGVRAQAVAAINKFEVDLAKFFAGASRGRLSQATAAAVVKVHLGHLLHQADAYSAKDYPGANQIYRSAYEQGFDLGRSLAQALLPTSTVAVMRTPAWQLQSSLDKLLGEHVVLVVAGMRAGATNSADFAPTAVSLDGNTRDLAGAVGSLFGDAAARQFQSLWADHVDALVSYSAAIAKSDQGQRVTARNVLAGFEGRMTAFLTGATKNRLVGTQLARALGEHDHMLLDQVEAFVAKDYTKAHDLSYTTYQEMISLAGTMAEAFRLTLGGRLPVGAPETGLGGMAGTLEHR